MAGSTSTLDARCCPKCSRNNQPNRRFCGGCGATLVRFCKRCQSDNDLDDAYCGNCGCLLRKHAANTNNSTNSKATGNASANARGARPKPAPPPVPSVRHVPKTPTIHASKPAEVGPQPVPEAVTNDLASRLAKLNANKPEVAKQEDDVELAQHQIDAMFNG